MNYYFDNYKQIIDISIGPLFNVKGLIVNSADRSVCYETDQITGNDNRSLE